MRTMYSDVLGTIRRRHERRDEPVADKALLSPQQQAWLERCAKRAAARQARLDAMREAAGPKPTAAIEAAIKQIQNRAEHSR
jgi:hypothetical protein